MRITTTLVGLQPYTSEEISQLTTLLSRPGAPGVKGSIWYAGAGAPSEAVGTAGDYYIDTVSLCLYGPKTTVWGDDFACIAGTVLTDLQVDVIEALANQTITLNPVGFIDNDNIGVAYDTVARTITLTHASGTIQYEWRGVLKTLVSPWTSSAHAVGAGRYFLSSSDGDTFAWSTAVWAFTDVHVAAAFPVLGFAVRETHGVMQHEVHLEAHDLLGTYRVSGLGPVEGTYALDTASDAATTPGFAAGVIKDEDNSSYVNASAEGTYTTIRIAAGSVATFDMVATFPFRSAGSYILTNNPTTGAETATATNRFVNIYEILIPVASDADSQKFRRVFLQPQTAYLSLAAALAEDTRGLNLGDFGGLAPEFVFYTRMTYATSAGNANTGKVTIPNGGVTYVVGTRSSQINVGAVLQATTAENVTFAPTSPDVATNAQTAIDARALKQSGQILGQSDARTDFTPADGGTVTIDCSLGNAFKITAPDTGAGMDYTVNFTNIPAGATMFAVSLLTVVGTNVPTVTYQVAGTPVTPTGTPTFTASKRNEWVVRTWDNGTTLLISGAAY